MDKLRKVAQFSMIVVSWSHLLLAQATQLPGVGSAVAPHTASPATTSSSPSAPNANRLLDGTPVKLRLAQTISSADAKAGQQVAFEVVEEIKVQDVVVIAKGAPALATVTDAEHKRAMGRGGKLDVNVDSVRLLDGEKATLRAVAGGKGGGHTGAMTGAIVATSILFFPAAPLFLFMHGKDITLAKGLETTAFVDGDMALKMEAFAPASMPMGQPTVSPTAITQVTVDANISNSDIDIDGNFAGSTPSKLSVAAGKHEIVVHRKGYEVWTRTINASGSEVRVYADLAVESSAAKTMQH